MRQTLQTRSPTDRAGENWNLLACDNLQRARTEKCCVSCIIKNLAITEDLGSVGAPV